MLSTYMRISRGCCLYIVKAVYCFFVAVARFQVCKPFKKRMKRNRPELSKNLLQMKFMQRTKENVERAKREELASAGQVDQDLLELCRKEGDRYLTTSSYVFCEDLRHGRMSFKGMNPEIEKLMHMHAGNAIQDDAAPDESEVDVSDREMANHMKRRKTRK